MARQRPSSNILRCHVQPSWLDFAQVATCAHFASCMGECVAGSGTEVLLVLQQCVLFGNYLQFGYNLH